MKALKRWNEFGLRCCRLLAVLAALVLLGGQVAECAGAPQPPAKVTLALSGTDVQVSFDTLTGQTYGVEWSDTLADGSWGALATSLAGSGSAQIVTDTGGALARQRFYRVNCQTIQDSTPAGFALIPAGSFQMGDALGDSGTNSVELPVHSVFVSAFYMEKLLVTYSQWQGVYAWAVAHGYSFDNVGSGKAANHPVQTVNWYDCVKWCNARSEQEGLAPSYTVGGAVYRTGTSDSVVCNPSGGYRLPTEAEWEKAAPGGLSGQRFPWGNTIDRSRANYYVYTSGKGNYYPYDLGTPGGFDPAWATGGNPYTSLVGSYATNGYGLYDMAGNVYEWCWDWYGTYGSGAVSDPHGPTTGSYRLLRGGAWNGTASVHRCASRNYRSPSNYVNYVGVRCARGL